MSRRIQKYRSLARVSLIPLLVIAVLALTVEGCATARGCSQPELRAEGPRVAERLCSKESPARSDHITREMNSPLALGPLPEWAPMPANYLDYVTDDSFALDWHFTLEGSDRSEPPQRILLGVSYYHGGVPEIAHLHGSVTINGSGFASDFPTAEPFLEIVDYLQAHEDVFFDHSEFSFQDIPMGWARFAQQANPQKEFFTFHVDPLDGNNTAYAICKFADFNTDTPKEVFLAIEKIKLLFTDPILGQWPPANRDPVCDLEDVDDYETEYGTPVTVTFDATNSYDLDFDTLTYAWDFDGDEVFGENPDDNYSGQPDNPTHIYDLPVGEHYITISVKVTDPDNAQSICETSFTITVEMIEAR
jgi:hypothetical protein